MIINWFEDRTLYVVQIGEVMTIDFLGMSYDVPNRNTEKNNIPNYGLQQLTMTIQSGGAEEMKRQDKTMGQEWKHVKMETDFFFLKEKRIKIEL